MRSCMACGGPYLPPSRAPLWPCCRPCSCDSGSGVNPWDCPGDPRWEFYRELPGYETEPEPPYDEDGGSTVFRVTDRDGETRTLLPSEWRAWSQGRTVRYAGTGHGVHMGHPVIVDRYREVCRWTTPS